MGAQDRRGEGPPGTARKHPSGAHDRIQHQRVATLTWTPRATAASPDVTIPTHRPKDPAPSAACGTGPLWQHHEADTEGSGNAAVCDEGTAYRPWTGKQHPMRPPPAQLTVSM